jgi:hypothetical protein
MMADAPERNRGPLPWWFDRQAAARKPVETR